MPAATIAALIAALVVAPSQEADTPHRDREPDGLLQLSSNLEAITGLSFSGEWTLRRFAGGWAASAARDDSSVVIGSSRESGGSVWSGKSVFVLVSDATGWLHATRDEDDARFRERMFVETAREKKDAEAAVESAVTAPEVEKALHDLSRLDHLAFLYASVKGKPPETLADLVKALPEFAAAGLFSDAIPSDPWGRPYAFAAAKDGLPDFVSLGADGREGGEGPARDLSLGALAAERGYRHFRIRSGTYSRLRTDGGFGDMCFLDDTRIIQLATSKLGYAIAEVDLVGGGPRDAGTQEGYVLSHGALAGAIIFDAEGVAIRFARRVE